jgi:hypothetical protein
MDAKMTVSFVLIGFAAIAAGVMGMRLPPGDRIAAGLALVVGAGVGVVALAIGSQGAELTPERSESVFLVASALGFAATIASLALLWRWASRDARGAGAERGGLRFGEQQP